MKLTIKNEDLIALNGCTPLELPKYASQIINLANQNAQGTRPKIVGQLSDLLPEYLSTTQTPNVKEWSNWYSKNYPNAINDASQRIIAQLNNLRESLVQITDDMVTEWVRDLILTKTFTGLYVQGAILSQLSKTTGKPYRLSTPDEEAKGIDGYVGTTAYSIKPDTYKSKNMLNEVIDVKMIYYTKTKTGLTLEIED